jgi:hypothetical protein
VADLKRSAKKSDEARTSCSRNRELSGWIVSVEKEASEVRSGADRRWMLGHRRTRGDADGAFDKGLCCRISFWRVWISVRCQFDVCILSAAMITKRAELSPQRNAGSRPFSGDPSVSETPSSLGPRG